MQPFPLATSITEALRCKPDLIHELERRGMKRYHGIFHDQSFEKQIFKELRFAVDLKASFMNDIIYAMEE